MKSFNVLTIENPTGTLINCVVTVTNLKDGRIKVVTFYKNGFKPYEEIMPINSDTFKHWFALNEKRLIIQ